jgi:RimJ/RimL family protein N-acetyltransferase
MAAINADPEVTRFLHGAATGPFLPKVQKHWDEHGFGFWAVESREVDLRDRCLGFVGVAYPTFLPELSHRPEIGWRLAREAWGRGYATEAAMAVRAYARTELAIVRLISIIHPDNVRSQRVATKLHMVRAETVHHPGMQLDVDVWSTR